MWYFKVIGFNFFGFGIKRFVNTMPLKFAANISTMFTEHKELSDRYQAAKECGFSAVECQFPYEYEMGVLADSKKLAGVEHILINSYPGNMLTGDFGYAAKPHYEKEFKESIDLTMNYAKALNCNRIHIIAGLMSKYIHDAEVEETYISNLKLAAKIFEKNNIIGLIEPICEVVKPQYFLTSFEKGIEYVKKINSPHLKLQMDIFHLQMICGNLTNSLKAAFPYIGHVQISQAPNRNEPNVPGEINYNYIFSLLEELGYQDWIGLEYFPKGNTKEGLKWLEEFGYSLN